MKQEFKVYLFRLCLVGIIIAVSVVITVICARWAFGG